MTSATEEKPIGLLGFLVGCVIIAVALVAVWWVAGIFIGLITWLVRTVLYIGVIAFLAFVVYAWVKNHRPRSN